MCVGPENRRLGKFTTARAKRPPHFAFQVLNLPSADEGTFIVGYTNVFFLDEFLILVSTPKSSHVPEFTLFDTLVSHDYPASSRRFRMPSKYWNWLPHIYVDDDSCLGTPDGDEPFITDPTQGVFVVGVTTDLGRDFITVRIQTLVGHLHSTSTASCVPWDKRSGLLWL